MKIEEKIAESYFKSIGYENVIFEPKGNRTPDFLIGSNIAVEVRRLNQFYNDEPLEKAFFKIVPKIQNLIESYNSGEHKKSAFVTILFRRPLNISKRTLNTINKILGNHSSKMEIPVSYSLNNLEIEIFPSEKKLATQYRYAGVADFDEGGVALSNIYDSLKKIIPEKNSLVEPFRSEYPIWWLALIDNIGYRLNESEILQISKSIDFDLQFDKVFLISNFKPIIGGEI